MIELGQHLLDFGDWVQSTLRFRYFEALTLVLSRGELNLSSLALHEPEKVTKKIYEKKIEVAIAYQLFIYKILEKCIKSLNVKGVEPYKRQFIENAITTCFFHIPYFRGHFLQLINEKEKSQVTELKISVKQSEIPILRHYNWQEYFYDKIPLDKQQDANDIKTELESFHGEKDWQERIKRRGNAFFLIVKAWVEYV